MTGTTIRSGLIFQSIVAIEASYFRSLKFYLRRYTFLTRCTARQVFLARRYRAEKISSSHYFKKKIPSIRKAYTWKICSKKSRRNMERGFWEWGCKYISRGLFNFFSNQEDRNSYNFKNPHGLVCNRCMYSDMISGNI